MTLVLCHGVFDLLHAGHVEHLRQAREMGERLVVSLVPDRFIEKKGRPIYREAERMALLYALKAVDSVVLCDAPGPQEVILAYRPNLYVRGSDYIGVAKPEDALLHELGIPIRYTRSVPPTTTQILQRMQCAPLSS